jgi:hypothetical protein
MKQILLTLILFLMLQICAFAQTEKLPCPKISIAGPSSTDSESPWTFTALVENQSDYPEVEYLWDTTAGKIISGQKTQTIKLDVRNTDGRNITVTVEIKGLPKGCPNTFSETQVV